MSELKKRVISGIILSVLFIFSFNCTRFYKIFLFIFVIIAIIFAMREFYNFIRLKNLGKPMEKVGITTGIIIATVFYLHTLPNMKNYALLPEWILSIRKVVEINPGFLISLFFLVLLFGFIYHLYHNHVDGILFSLGTTFMGIIYIPLTMSHIFLVSVLPDGIFYIWLISFSTVMTDTMAYFSGKLFGKNRIKLIASPNKTWEGYLGGFLGQVILTHLFYHAVKAFFVIPEISFIEITIFSVTIFITSVVGDLSESTMKRDSGVKDSGSIIPGHGGVLDLLDALMFTIPSFYYSFITIKMVKAWIV